ncbi:uncharacterized protein LOC129729918 isoform X2 [Wyeomyia smithii]|uniref:uncharacterized protein LOC129729918 isoform X2 n=1 Tax=Wyeomyia smithii TaxID=174621 RepID=UPI002467ED12|nr:uncharacterized protein LOC129729918 isoform X2 [Wyeomyia smithii]
MVVSYDVINAKLRNRLDHLQQNHANPKEKFRLLKRYLSHFVKLVRYGRLFESSFYDHLQMIVSHLNDRYPIDLEALGTVIRTLCVICYTSEVPYQMVIIGLQGLLDIFERISGQETLNVLQCCNSHIKRLISQIKKFKYMKIQMQLVELVYVSSLAYAGKSVERREYVKGFIGILGDFCLELLDWKPVQVTEECRNFLMRLHTRNPDLNVLSVPVERFGINEYNFTKLNNMSTLWLDFNFRPATIHFSAAVVVNHGNHRNEMTINVEVLHSSVSHVEFTGSDEEPGLKISYTAICLNPAVINVDKKGSLIFRLSPEFDYTRFRTEVLPSIQTNQENEESYGPYSLCLDGLLNMSLQNTFPSVSATAASVFDQSERLQEHREAIEQHKKNRQQILNDLSTGDSNKENEIPADFNHSRSLSQDVQRLRVFEPLVEDCQRRINRDLNRQRCSNQQTVGKRRISTEKRSLKKTVDRLKNNKHDTEELRCPTELEQPKSNESSAKKRKLYANKVEENELNASKDSQTQRNIFVERKLVNTVKPMKTQEEKFGVSAEDHEYEKLETSADITTSEEFQQSLKAYIDNNGIFGITQQKILDKKLENNIRKINQIVDRTTRRFFKREPSENPYEFNEPGDRTKKRKMNNTTTKKAKQKPDDADPDFLPNRKAIKNKCNVSRRNKTGNLQSKTKTEMNVSQPVLLKTEPLTQRKSLPRKTKPSAIVDLISDTEHTDNDDLIPLKNSSIRLPKEDTFQDFNISPMESEHWQNRRSLEPKAKDSTHKPSIMPTGLKSGKRTPGVNAMKGNSKTRALIDASTENVDSSTMFTLRNFNKPTENVLQKTTMEIIEQEKIKNQKRESFSSLSENSVGCVVSIKSITPPCKQTEKQSAGLSRCFIRSHPESLSDSRARDGIAKYNMEYAHSNFMLNKYIAESHNVDRPAQTDEGGANGEPQEGDVSVQVSSMREAPVRTSVSCDSLSTHYPMMKNITTENIHDELDKNKTNTDHKPFEQFDRSSFKRISSDEENIGTHVKVSQVQTERQKTSAAKPVKERSNLAAVMIAKFKENLHQQLNPALSEMENKIGKLNGMQKVFEQLSTDFHAKEISMKCKEIVALEEKLDKLLDDVASLCKDSNERSNYAFQLGKNLVKYDKSKRKDYIDQLDIGRQEMPLIVNDCIKDVWNEQVYTRKLQLELLLKKMLM